MSKCSFVKRKINWFETQHIFQLLFKAGVIMFSGKKFEKIHGG